MMINDIFKLINLSTFTVSKTNIFSIYYCIISKNCVKKIAYPLFLVSKVDVLFVFFNIYIYLFFSSVLIYFGKRKTSTFQFSF